MNLILKASRKNSALEYLPRNYSARSTSLSPSFDFMIVVDFESTCDNKTGHYLPPEIIEFPAVLVELKTRNFLEIFHKYVRPTENPILTTFCKNFTGISQDKVDIAFTLDKTLQLYDNWLKDMMKRFSFDFDGLASHKAVHVTWTDWDFRICLFNECQRKGVAFPAYFLQRIDLKALFQEWLKTEHSKSVLNRQKANLKTSLKDSLDLLGIGFIGRPHSGIDDAKNTCRLLFTILNLSQ